ncbi:Radical SAM protein [Candidatus Desulfarcum epimagneticum]|uniref:Radical SAM protein n=1 Tax=uncultured Desulfobacteraceae bacterium TaxID=218296 RepID=A0A484HIB5_9BACT|nr:Radical SAM protein [uncultured Desulfobacteraceae bacterium]
MNADLQKEKLAEIQPFFKDKLHENGIAVLAPERLEILQVHITRKCNLRCRHCHVESSAHRKARMSDAVLEKCLELASSDPIQCVDITGGAPETHGRLEWFLGELAQTGRRIITRSNLAILTEPPYDRFLDIYAENQVELAGSLPHFTAEKYEKQRGKANFQKAIQALKALSERGYGREGSGLILDLVHNPAGAFLAADQRTLEHEYRKNLLKNHGVRFNHLFSISNMPVGRFLDYLIETDNFDDYALELVNAFNPLAARNVMCKFTLNVAPDGSIFNCDFNQMLEIPAPARGKAGVFDLTPGDLDEIGIAIHNHCYGCAAGSGSSCQGATA